MAESMEFGLISRRSFCVSAVLSTAFPFAAKGRVVDELLMLRNDHLTSDHFRLVCESVLPAQYKEDWSTVRIRFVNDAIERCRRNGIYTVRQLVLFLLKYKEKAIAEDRKLYIYYTNTAPSWKRLKKGIVLTHIGLVNVSLRFKEEE